MKRKSTEWEKIVENNITNKGLISKIYIIAHTTQHQKNNPIKKWAEHLTYIFPKIVTR